ncbi:phage tail sheath family protein [Nitrosovibrio tenuis]|uniref:Tail sheath protein C-terminal domain-containing protein n=1 Tax=Nitrosovibrio tenuis TaxID=1233 RepID=A0A1H7MKV6_9PROT|nr:phage tail sheath subtilisin-like domain-containing protein [Nitrosovibrio tenuis]SEL11832.1 hypothetical protein SAMN05216387_105124 [Nitrosovibrio tenuis]
MGGSIYADTSRVDHPSASRAPGVYYETFFEREAQPAFRTGVPVFVGFAKRLGRATQPTSRIYHLDRWPQLYHFETIPESYLGHAVRGFFENGGEHCVVVPVESAHQGPDMAKSLKDIFERGGVLDDLEDVDLVCVPDAMLPDIRASRQTVYDIQSMTLEHCHRMGDRFAILDGFPANTTPRQDSRDRGNRGIDSAVSHWQKLPPDHGALYYPWISVKELPHRWKPHPSIPEMPCDEYYERLSNQGTSGAGFLKVEPARLVPPCGHMAGIYSRSDARVGVHKAPANELVEEVLKLEIDFSDDELAELNNPGVNCLRGTTGGGIRVWGARTLNGHPHWSHINVKRLFLTLTRWIRKNMNDVVYETNDPHLWECVRARLADYCRNLFDNGALKGNSPEQAFYVKCDAETNTRDRWEAGEVVAEVGLAPTVPLEFIVVRITQNASTTTVSGLNLL